MDYRAPAGEDPAAPFRNLDTGPVTTAETRPLPWSDAADAGVVTVDEIVERQRSRYGGIKVGSAFFGWIVAMAVPVIVVGLAAVAGSAFGLDVAQSPKALTSDLPVDPDAAVWIGVGALLAVLLAAFYCGGYVAGRMARFSGIVQGLAVWAWALLAAIAVAAVGVIPATSSAVLDVVDALPRLPLPEDALPIAVIVAVVAVVVVSAGGALLGGTIGVRYHRRVDAFGVEA